MARRSRIRFPVYRTVANGSLPARGDRALAGLRVLELGHGIAGPFATRLLADLGAEVVKVERSPDGDFVRRLGPFVTDARGRSRSALFEYVNWSKRSVALDLDDTALRPRLEQLLAWADVVVLAFRPRRLKLWDLEPRALHALNPRLTVCAISNFGLEGPQADDDATDLIFQATGGLMAISGSTEREPLKSGLRQSLYCAGLNAAYASLAAYRAARDTGQGVCLDLAIRDCVASQLVMNETYYAFMGAVQGRRPPSQDPFNGDPLPTADGFVSIQLNTFTPIGELAELFGDERLKEPRFASPAARVRECGALREILEEQLRWEPSREFFVRASEQGQLTGFAQGAQELLDCSQLAARAAFSTIDRVEIRGSGIRFPARLLEFSSTPLVEPSAAPDVGEQDGARLPPRAARTTGGASHATGPLDDIRVLDLSTVFAVPYIGGLLADLGAEVIKIESPRRLDQSRSGFGGSFDNDTSGDYWNRSTAFHVLNRGKRAMCVDLAQPEGQDLLRSMVSEVDIVLENFTPRVMRNWGTTYEALSAINPALIMLSNTGYGATGPWSGFKSQGTTLEATMGLTHYTGYEGGKPMKVGQSYPDFLACWAGLTGIMAALLHRDRTGGGQHLDLGMYQLGSVVIPEAILAAQIDGTDMPRRGNRDLDDIVSGVFRALGDDQWLALSVQSEDQLQALAQVVPGVAEAVAVDAGRAGIGVVELAIANWARERDAWEAAAVLQQTGVPAGPVCDARDLIADEQLRARGFYEAVDYGPQLGPRPLIGRPYRWSGGGGQVAVRGPGPRFAEGNRQVLDEILGLNDDALTALYDAGILFDAPVGPPKLEPHPLERMLADRSFASIDPGYRHRLVEASALTTSVSQANTSGPTVNSGTAGESAS